MTLKKQIKDLIKELWNVNICVFKKHTISHKDWDTLTPLLPTIDARCTRCGYPFILYLDEKTRKKRAKPMYDDGGF